MPYSSPTPGISFDINQVPTPYPAAPFVPMLAGMPIENKIQQGMLARGIRNRSPFNIGTMGNNPLGGQTFRGYLESAVRGELPAPAQVTGWRARLGVRPRANITAEAAQGLLDAARGTGSKKGLEGAFRQFIKTKPLSQSIFHSVPLARSSLITDAFMVPMYIAQNEMRKAKLTPAAAQFGRNVAINSPTLQIRTASLKRDTAFDSPVLRIKGGSMNKRAGIPGNIATTALAMTAAGALTSYLATKARDVGRNSIGRDWEELVRRYPEFNASDRNERENIMDIYEGLHAMSPEIAKSPVLAAPIIRNAMEYGLKGFAPSEMKTMVEINKGMSPSFFPGTERMTGSILPKPE